VGTHREISLSARRRAPLFYEDSSTSELKTRKCESPDAGSSKILRFIFSLMKLHDDLDQKRASAPPRLIPSSRFGGGRDEAFWFQVSHR